MDTTIAVRYHRLTNTKMEPLAGSWEELVTALAVHRETLAKEDGELWSPVIPLSGGPARRCNAAVAAVSAVVLDVDDGTPLDEVVAPVAGEWIAYSTWNHDADHPRYHVVLRLDTPVPADEWRETYKRLNPHVADWLPAVSHAYFLPQHAPGAQWFVRRSA